MMSISRAFVGLGALSMVGCTPWAQTGIDRLTERLERGPARMECYTSAWAKSQEFDQPKPSVLDGAHLRLDPHRALWKQSDDAVIAFARTTFAGYLWEFSVTEFGPSHAYASDRYYCSKAAIPVNQTPPPLGQMTDEGTAMDGEFREIANPFDQPPP
ncbi:MAG: hypothetical protein VX072_04750 [Pseudomonadota bacterium]|jgi:hypothetical protein|uniref:hypothetical protein n=1 Tax=Sphingomonadales TaxID=204457 RepID=UPI0012E2539D|nr:MULTISPECIES: hypothetical protein [Sphingomonadales]MEC8178953.1 hypothetical protein [Pseudomonadota bacterium]|tara:strand:+ start:1319 stop:1789 length:471 start_codon:yes stop_codon:yes gene_type:complete